MNEFELSVLNTGLILNCLLRKKSKFTVYLDDGLKLTGTLLGWDADFLLIKEGDFLQMVRFGKITRLQAELDEILATDNPVTQNNSNPASTEMMKFNPSPSSSVLSNFKPILTEVKTPSGNSEKVNPGERSDSKNRLDQLVKNW